MARYRTTVEELAKEANLSAEEVIFFVCNAGVRIGSNNIISQKWLARSRKALELPDKPPQPHKTQIVLPSKPFGEEIKGLKEVEPEVVLDSIPPCPEKAEVIGWRQIGKIQHIEYLTVKEVEVVHGILVEDFRLSGDPIAPPGVRSLDLLNSAMHRPQTAIGQDKKYCTVVMAGAAMVHGLVLNHPFHNGNKRTAMVSLLVFLDKNGVIVKGVDENDLYQFFIKIANHGLIESKSLSTDGEMLLIADWIDSHTRSLMKSEYLLKFHELKRILFRYGATVYHARGNTRGILRIVDREELHSKISVRNDGSEIKKATMQKIRYDLKLDEEHGYDSDIFYDAKEKIPEFINTYRNVLNRLAHA